MDIDLTVSDIRASAAFYAKLGLEVPDVWEHEGTPHHVQIPDGPALNSVALTKGYDEAWPDGSPGAMLIHHVGSREDVDAKHLELAAAGYVSHLAPMDAFWGARYAVVDDPDGNHIGIMSPSDREHASAPGL
jgi:uncharacterized glyoxalase superfamily protein PhnB